MIHIFNYDKLSIFFLVHSALLCYGWRFKLHGFWCTSQLCYSCHIFHSISPFKELALNSRSESSDKSNDKNHRVICRQLYFPQRTKMLKKHNTLLVTVQFNLWLYFTHLSRVLCVSFHIFCHGATRLGGCPQGRRGSRGQPQPRASGPLVPSQSPKLPTWCLFFVIVAFKNIFKSKIINYFYKHHYSIGASLLQVFIFYWFWFLCPLRCH